MFKALDIYQVQYRGVHSMLTMKQLASLEKQGGGEVEKGVLHMKLGGREFIFQ